MKISIVAPMFNEQDNLQHTLQQVKDELKQHPEWDYEIIFVNDGSTDNTWERAKELASTEEKLIVLGYADNQGRGKAMRTGFEAASGDIIVTIDFDLSYDASHISKMVKELQDNNYLDLVLTSVYMPGGKTIGVPLLRLIISKLGNYTYRFAFSPKIHTSTCIVRAYKKQVLDDLLLESKGKEIHLEILTKVLSLGYTLKEIPGTLSKRKIGKSKFKFGSTSISHFIYLIQEKPSLLFGIIGLAIMLLAMLSTSILIYTRFGNDIGFKATYLSRIVSPNFVIIMFLAGLQMLGIGYISIQNNALRKELFKIQKQLRNQTRQ